MPTEPFKGDETETAPVAPDTSGQVPVPATTEPGYITSKELNEALQGFGKSLDEKLSNLYRGLQSQNDKLQSRVQKKIELYEAAAQSQGFTLTPSQKQQLTDQTTIEELREASKSTVPVIRPDQGIPQPAQDPEVEKVNFAADKLIQLAGITFDEGDPEGALIDKAADGTAEQYLNAVQEAIRLKKERLASGGKETPQRAPAGGVPGAIPGSPNANPIANIMDKDQLWEIAKKQGKI